MALGEYNTGTEYSAAKAKTRAGSSAHHIAAMFNVPNGQLAQLSATSKR
jgi:hypothetical protein